VGDRMPNLGTPILNCCFFGRGVLVLGVALASFDVICYEFEDSSGYVYLMQFVDEVMYVNCIQG
jgi:hypothetical protein